MTHSRFPAANSFSRLTSSVSFVSVESISNPFLSSRATSLLKRLRLRCCRRQIPQIRHPPPCAPRKTPQTPPHPPPPPPRTPPAPASRAASRTPSSAVREHP